MTRSATVSRGSIEATRTAAARVRTGLQSRRARAIGILALVLVGMVFMATAPALAQTNTTTTVSEGDICDTKVYTTVNNALIALTVLGPLIGFANAGWNMTKAAGTNNSSKKKEYKSNIKSGIIYGLAVGMLLGIVTMITSFAPGVTGMC